MLVLPALCTACILYVLATARSMARVNTPNHHASSRIYRWTSSQVIARAVAQHLVITGMSGVTTSIIKIPLRHVIPAVLMGVASQTPMAVASPDLEVPRHPGGLRAQVHIHHRPCLHLLHQQTRLRPRLRKKHLQRNNQRRPHQRGSSTSQAIKYFIICLVEAPS